MPRDTGRPRRRNRPTQPSYTCAVCGQTVKRQDAFLQHLRTEHGLEDAPAFDPDVPSDPQSGDEGDEAEQPAANHGPPVPPAVNHKLSGPPEGTTATLAVARLYRCGEQLTAFLPPVLEESTFYLADDPEQLADALLGELRLLQRHWLRA